MRTWSSGEPRQALSLADWLSSLDALGGPHTPLLLCAGGSLLPGDWAEESDEQACLESGLVLPPEVALQLDQAGGRWLPLGVALQSQTTATTWAVYLAQEQLTLTSPDGSYLSLPLAEDGPAGKWVTARLLIRQALGEEEPRRFRLYAADATLRAGYLSCLDSEPRLMPLRLGGGASAAFYSAVRQSWQDLHAAYRFGILAGCVGLAGLATALVADDSSLPATESASTLALQAAPDPGRPAGLLDILGREATVRSVALARIELELEPVGAAVLRVWPEQIAGPEAAADPSVRLLGNAPAQSISGANPTPDALSSQIDSLLNSLPGVVGEAAPTATIDLPGGRERRIVLQPADAVAGESAVPWFAQLQALARREGVQLPPLALDGQTVETTAQPAAQQARWLLASLPILHAHGLQQVRMEQPSPSEGLPLGLLRVSIRLAR